MAEIPDILAKILVRKQQEVNQRKAAVSLDAMERQARNTPACRGFYRSITNTLQAGRPAVIAEIKKASPSKGVIRKDFNPAAIAASYAKAGATCLSVLTDIDFFMGSDEYLQQARAACPLPVLRKDFILEPYQVFEARTIGADCILLIVAALGDTQLLELSGIAADLNMDILVEVHNREELERSLMIRAPLIGINNRDLHTFATTLETTIRLLVDIKDGCTVVTESGIHTRADIQLMQKHGVNAFLVGETFMTARDPGEKLKELFS